MRVLFINDSTSNPNWGDRAAAMALKTMIREDGHEIVGVLTEDDLREGSFWGFPDSGSATARSTGSHSKRWLRLLVPPAVFKVRSRLAASLASPPPDFVPVRCADFEARVREILAHPEKYSVLLSKLEQCDVLVIHGDGCMVADNRLGRTELLLAYLAKLAFERKVILINHTADFGDSELGKIARKVYPLLDDVRFREPISVERCRDFCAGVYCPDSAFYFTPARREVWAELASRPGYFDVWPDVADFDPRQPYVCVGGSSIYSFGGKPVEIIEDFLALVRHLEVEYSGQVVLTASDLKDELIFSEVAKETGLPLIGLSTPVQQAVDIVGNADAYIGGRWHPGIFALSGGTPLIPIQSKTFKIKGLADMAKMQVPVFDATDLSGQKEAIAAALHDCLREGRPLRIRLANWARTQREACRQNLAFLGRAQRASLSERRHGA